MLFLKQSDYHKMMDHAKAVLPEEACGLLAGTTDGDRKEIKEVYLLTNVDHAKDHFSMEPAEQLAAIRDMRTKGWVLLGNWHSHPSSCSFPSEEDRRLAFDPDIDYLILSLMEAEAPVLRAFHIDRIKQVTEEKILIQ